MPSQESVLAAQELLSAMMRNADGVPEMFRFVLPDGSEINVIVERPHEVVQHIVGISLGPSASEASAAPPGRICRSCNGSGRVP